MQEEAAHLSVGAQILDAAASTSSRSRMGEHHKYVYSFSAPFSLVFFLASNGLYPMAITVIEKSFECLQLTLYQIETSIENRELFIVQWISPKEKIADDLTRKYHAAFRL